MKMTPEEEILDLAMMWDYSAEQVPITGGPTDGKIRWQFRKLGTNERFWPREGMTSGTALAFLRSIPLPPYTAEEIAEMDEAERESLAD